MTKHYNIRRLLDRRKELRQRATPQEEKLWWYLRAKRLGPKFRRQNSICGYILDFICLEKKLIIELDGEVHENLEAKEYDKVRDKFFTDLGYKVLRFKNSEVDTRIEEVIKKIKENI